MAGIIWHDRVDSTNSLALRQISTLDNLSVLAAREQTAGRGQRGNRWLSRPGENLTFSAVLKFGEGGLAPLAARDALSVGTIVAFLLYSRSFGRPVNELAQQFNDLVHFRIAERFPAVGKFDLF